MPIPADWQLPTGVSRAVWEYTNDSSVANRYDTELAGTPLLEADRRLLFGLIHEGQRVLDLGCGTGRLAEPLSRRRCRVIGIDLSRPMLKVARQKTTERSIDWVCGNIVQLPFASGDFDAAICMFSTLGMISGSSARQAAISEARRILKPQGLFVLHVHNVWHLMGTRDGRRQLRGDLVKRLGNKDSAGDFAMPASESSPGWTMHLFTWREVKRLLKSARFTIEQRVAVGIDGVCCHAWSAWRAYGWFIVARRAD